MLSGCFRLHVAILLPNFNADSARKQLRLSSLFTEPALFSSSKQRARVSVSPRKLSTFSTHQRNWHDKTSKSKIGTRLANPTLSNFSTAIQTRNGAESRRNTNFPDPIHRTDSEHSREAQLKSFFSVNEEILSLWQSAAPFALFPFSLNLFPKFPHIWELSPG